MTTLQGHSTVACTCWGGSRGVRGGRLAAATARNRLDE